MPPESDSVVRTTGLTKVFRDFWLREKVTAVADLDVDIRQREVFGLLGPNGSGKSTTLKMILGLLFPTRGRIAVFGRRPTDVAIKARIGFLPEESYLYPFLDATETLDFYGRLFRQPRRQRRRRIEMLLEMVGLKSVAYRRVGEYSKGMQRRIGLAQALINDPDLLILDEPTGGMDPIGTRQFKDLIRTLAARGKTVILSSHLLADVEDVCDRVCILYGGRKRAQGTLQELLAHGDRTQITTDCLDEESLKAIEQVLAARGRELLAVSAPRVKLESLFMRIVQEAQEQRLITGGAIALVAAAEPQQAPEAAEEPAEDQPPEVAREVIEELTTATTKRPEHVEPPKSSSAAAPQADRSVIDGLISDATEDDEE